MAVVAMDQEYLFWIIVVVLGVAVIALLLRDSFSR
jgi:hypothetical protein